VHVAESGPVQDTADTCFSRYRTEEARLKWQLQPPIRSSILNTLTLSVTPNFLLLLNIFPSSFLIVYDTELFTTAQFVNTTLKLHISWSRWKCGTIWRGGNYSGPEDWLTSRNISQTIVGLVQGSEYPIGLPYMIFDLPNPTALVHLHRMILAVRWWRSASWGEMVTTMAFVESLDSRHGL